MELPEPVVPSPKFHVKPYGGTPPLAVAMNETEAPVDGFEGEKVKVAVRGWGLPEGFQAVNGWSSQWPASQ